MNANLIISMDGKEHTYEERQRFVRDYCNKCVFRRASYTGFCYALTQRIMPCSFFLPKSVYSIHTKTGFPYKRMTETVQYDDEKGIWEVG